MLEFRIVGQQEEVVHEGLESIEEGLLLREVPSDDIFELGLEALEYLENDGFGESGEVGDEDELGVRTRGTWAAWIPTSSSRSGARSGSPIYRKAEAAWMKSPSFFPTAPLDQTSDFWMSSRALCISGQSGVPRCSSGE